MRDVSVKSDRPVDGQSRARVCVVAGAIPPVFSGSGLCAYRYAYRLHRAGRLAFIVAEQPAGDTAGEEGLHREALALPGKVLRLPARSFRRRYRAQEMAGHKLACLRQALHLWASAFHVLLVKRNEYDIVFGFESAGQLVLYATLAARLLGKKAILTISLLGTDDPVTLRQDGHRTRRWFRTKAFGAANGYVSISPPITEACRKAGVPSHKVWEIPNPVDVSLFAPCNQAERKSLRNDLGIPGPTFALLFVGGMIRRKGIDLLIEALGQLRRAHDDIQLLMIGPRVGVGENEPGFLDRLDERIRQLELTNRVRFVGLADNVHHYMKASDVFVFPSRAEGFGTVLVEAMVSGLPVVTCQLGGIARYIITHEVDGLIVDYTPEAIAEAVERLYRDPAFRKRIAISALRTARSRFATEIVDSHYDRMFHAMFTTPGAKTQRHWTNTL